MTLFGWPDNRPADDLAQRTIATQESAIKALANALAVAADDLDQASVVLRRSGQVRPGVAAKNCADRARQAAEGWI